MWRLHVSNVVRYMCLSRGVICVFCGVCVYRVVRYMCLLQDASLCYFARRLCVVLCMHIYSVVCMCLIFCIVCIFCNMRCLCGIYVLCGICFWTVLRVEGTRISLKIDIRMTKLLKLGIIVDEVVTLGNENDQVHSVCCLNSNIN